MKTYPERRPARHVRVPAFAPVLLRCRSDGWTPARQAAFLAALALTGSVCEAARRVGMARETAYRLRRKPGAESFAASWDTVLGREVGVRAKVTPEQRARRAIEGLLKPMIYRGRHVGTSRKTDNTALLGYVSRLVRMTRDIPPDHERSHGFEAALASAFEGDRLYPTSAQPELVEGHAQVPVPRRKCRARASTGSA